MYTLSRGSSTDKGRTMASVFSFVIAAAICLQAGAFPPEEAELQHWHTVGVERVKYASQRKVMDSRAKNVVMFLGDGMGFSAVTAGRIYVGQKDGKHSEQTPLSWERFAYGGMQKTYSVDYTTTDSAASATAYLCGTKAHQGTIGSPPKVKRGDCSSLKTEIKLTPVESVAAWAIEQGMWAGVVTTTRITHATPSASYAHSADRDWESDFDMHNQVQKGEYPPDILQCADIASQLVDSAPGNKLRVIMGGGRSKMFPNTTFDVPANKSNERMDGRNLVDEWLNITADNRMYVDNRAQLLDVDATKTDYLMGLFNYDHIKYQLEHEQDNDKTQPTLEEMVEKAIAVLSRSPNGYFLLVEGGRIDLAEHINKAHLALEELRQMHMAVDKARNMTNRDDTLVVVTADHSHTMVLTGYPMRNVSILGTFDQEILDGMPSTILSFNNGPAARFHQNGTRRNLTGVDTEAIEFEQPTFLHRDFETHGGEEVGIWADGPWSHLFTGTMENVAIAHAMGFAFCGGPAKQACMDYEKSRPADPNPSSNSTLLIVLIVVASTALIFLIILVALFAFRLRSVRRVNDSNYVS